MRMKFLQPKSLVAALAMLVIPLALAAAPAPAADFAAIDLGASRVIWDVAGGYDRAVLTVSRPDGTVLRKEFRAGTPPAFDLADAAGNLAADGAYTWELVLAPRLTAQQKAALATARRLNDPGREAQIFAAAGIKPQSQSGTFSVLGGVTVPNDLQEPRSGQGGRQASSAPSADRRPGGPLTAN